MMQKILEILETTDDFDEIINSVSILKDFCNRFNIISDQKEVSRLFWYYIKFKQTQRNGY